MQCVYHNSNDPYFNIASEEYLLKNFTDDIFMLYQNAPSIIVGKHQNTFAEINYWYVKEKDIKVVRRLSGGGTVFHDFGNLNFCFIQNGKEGNLVDFKRFTQPIIEVLQTLGVNVQRSGRNDLVIDGLKISGNAEHIYKNRILHHGTLLYSSELASLRDALKAKIHLFEDKAVKSVRSHVTNISEYLPKHYSLQEFQERIKEHIRQKYSFSKEYTFTEVDISCINQLIEEKYSKWNWDFGYSPKFVFENKAIVDGKEISVKLEVEKGIIGNAEYYVDRILATNIIVLLKGLEYREHVIFNKLIEADVDNIQQILKILI